MGEKAHAGRCIYRRIWTIFAMDIQIKIYTIAYTHSLAQIIRNEI
jgi:hypothetical protein